MKVITFNIRCKDDENGHSIAERAPRLKQTLAKYDADLIGFQEAVPAWMKFLEANYADGYEIFHRYRAEKSLEGTPILWKKSRFDCLDKGWFWLSDTPQTESRGWDTRGCCRIALWAKLLDKMSGKPVLFINTHYGFSDACQIASGKLILDFIRSKNVRDVILTADFNMTPDSAGYQVLNEALIDVNEATARDNGDTFHGYLTKRGSHIDFCFVSDSIQPVASHRMIECYDGKFPSDHYGVYSEIELDILK